MKEIGVCPEKLNESIIDDHLREIALFLTSWRTVASHLDLNENDLDDAEQGGRKVKDKSLKALQIWKGKFGFRATYKKLVEVLLSLAMADVAEKVCNLLKGMCMHMCFTHQHTFERCVVPGAKMTEVEVRVSLVCASTDDGRLLIGGTNLVSTWGRFR